MSSLQYFKIFGPNCFVVIFSTISFFFGRVTSPINLETMEEEINNKTFKFC